MIFLLSPSTLAKRLARHFTLGRSRVLTPVPPDQVWVFFRGFPKPSHRDVSHSTDKANAGSIPLSRYLPPSFRTHAHRTHPESSRQPQPPAPLLGEMKNVSFPSFFLLSEPSHTQRYGIQARLIRH
jgi:hypothetical protein